MALSKFDRPVLSERESPSGDALESMDGYSHAVIAAVDLVGPSEDRIGELVPIRIVRRGELRRILVAPREIS